MNPFAPHSAVLTPASIAPRGRYNFSARNPVAATTGYRQTRLQCSNDLAFNIPHSNLHFCPGPAQF